MTLAASRWPTFVDAGPAHGDRLGALVVWRWELSKLAGQIRVRVMAVLCLLVPFVVVGALKVQSAVPQDTLFGQWVHTSGFAVPLVILGFCGQWVLPLLTSVVAGDIFSSEDHFGTWKTVMTRSRTRGQIFLGKLAAALSYTMVMLAILIATSLLAGLLMGTQPLVGLSGQLVAPGRAEALVLASWATQVPPVLGFCALAVTVSVLSRNSVVGIGAPVVAGLVMQLATLVNMPQAIRAALLANPFQTWHGFWVEPHFYGPFLQGLITCFVWFVICLGLAWTVFRFRSVRVA
jgi:ABC-2 type transport system permease protein